MQSALRLLAFIAFLALFTSGCVQTQSLKSADLLSTPNLLQEADTAWQAKRYEPAELYYSKLLERQDIAIGALPVINARLAQAAYINGHFHQANIALEAWANLDAHALENAVWESTYIKTLAALDKTERLQNHLKWVLGANSVPWLTRREVALLYSAYFRQKDDSGRALGVLNQFYAMAPDTAAKAAFEQEYLQNIQAIDDSQLTSLTKAVTAVNQWRFPYALVGFERGVRDASGGDSWSMTWRNLRNLVGNAELADMIPLETKLAELEAKYGVPRIGLALVLPLTGPYGKVGVKVLRGAGLAQWQLAQDGIDVDLQVINTETPGWEKRLAALPAHYSVVGGPLRVEAFKKLYEGKAPGERELDKRAFFTFLASTGDQQEGKDAWRFFTSHNDEVRSLVKLTVDRLGIKNLAVFYPEEKFGRTMAETFYREAAPLGGQIKGMQSYPSKDLKQWSKRTAKLLKVPDNFSENKDVPLAMPDFGAVFLPDGWNQAQTLLPNFFFYEGDQLVYLGPGLWSRSLDSATDIDEHYFQLAVCPGAWWDAGDGGHALQSRLTEEGLGQADFWVALGFDFLRFAGKLGTLPTGWSADEVNRRLASAQKINFSMAPMTWDATGVASQDLYLFSPARNGKELVNVEEFKERVARASARRERRVDAYETRMKQAH